jgi:hypothetical protein
MRARILAAAAAVWAVAYSVLYLVIIRAQGNSPLWWYPALAVLAAALLAGAALARPGLAPWPRRALAGGLVVLAAAALPAAASIGILLAPAIVAAGVALGSGPGQPGGRFGPQVTSCGRAGGTQRRLGGNRGGPR